MYRYKLTIEYFGGDFCGWQAQNNTVTVQQTIEEALKPLLKIQDKNTRLFCAGRTDTGVHALGQVAHVDLSRNMEGEKLLKALNYYLHRHRITIINCENLGATNETDFHARFSCTARSYQYRIVNRLAPLAIEKNLAWHIPYPLNEDQMHKAAQYLLGQHDFSSFRAAGCQANSALRTLNEISVTRQHEEVLIFVAAPSFLYHQVRNIVGSLVLVGQEKWTTENFVSIFKAKDRTKAGPTAPAEGLYFLAAQYE